MKSLVQMILDNYRKNKQKDVTKETIDDEKEGNNSIKSKFK